MANNHGFWKTLLNEVEPIIKHAAVVLLLEISLLLCGLIILLLEHLFPERKDLFQEMEAVDLWLVLALLCLFGVYTLIVVGIRLFRGLWKELRGGQSKKGDDEND